MTFEQIVSVFMLVIIVFLVGYGLGRYDHEFEHEGECFRFDKQGQPYPDGNTAAWLWRR